MFDFKGFVLGRPPQVVFIVCLAAFGIILMSFAYHVKNRQMRDPDISEDWNFFLRNLSHLGFCIIDSNRSDITTASSMTSPSTTKLPVTTTESSSADDDVESYSVSMWISVTPTRDFVNIPHNLTYLSGSITGDQLGFQGKKADEVINMTMQLPVNWNETCHSSQQHCTTVKIYSCVYFQASKHVFPGSRSPQSCHSTNETGTEYHARIRGDQRSTEVAPEPIVCRSQPHIQLTHNSDPTLTVYLTVNDRSVINLHLMHTSYFLFVMVITLLIYAALKGHRSKTASTHPDTVELLSNSEP